MKGRQIALLVAGIGVVALANGLLISEAYQSEETMLLLNPLRALSYCIWSSFCY
jgi:hypothetical protein